MMVFRSRKDAAYLGVMGVIFLIAFSGLILPIILGETEEPLLPIAIFAVTAGVLIWFILSMEYTLHDDNLLVKSAFVKKRIRYEDITGIRQLSGIGEMLTGYQLLTSKEGIEISYRSNAIGSVKISPEKQDVFLAELKKRCPGMEVGT